MRGVTSSQVRAIAFEVISTHTPHARRDIKDEISKFLGVISTHTPHARRDAEKSLYAFAEFLHFNSHASCEA